MKHLAVVHVLSWICLLNSRHQETKDSEEAAPIAKLDEVLPNSQEAAPIAKLEEVQPNSQDLSRSKRNALPLVADSLAILLTVVKSVLHPLVSTVRTAVTHVLYPIASELVQLVFPIIVDVVEASLIPAEIILEVLDIVRHISLNILKIILEGPIGEMVEEVKEITKIIIKQTVMPVVEQISKIKMLLEGWGQSLTEKFITAILEPLLKDILVPILEDVLVPLVEEVLVPLVEEVLVPLVTEVLVPGTITLALAPVVGGSMALDALGTVLVDFLGLPEPLFNAFKQVVHGAIGLSVLWVVPEGLLIIPFVALLEALRHCDPTCEGEGKFSAFGLVVVELFLASRTVPGLWQKLKVERSWQREAIDILEERVQRALVKYRHK